MMTGGVSTTRGQQYPSATVDPWTGRLPMGEPTPYSTSPRTDSPDGEGVRPAPADRADVAIECQGEPTRAFTPTGPAGGDEAPAVPPGATVEAPDLGPEFRGLLSA